MEYAKATAAKLLAEERVIPDWHPHLEGYRIAYVKVDRITKLGHAVGARIKLASKLEKHLSDYDMVLQINAEVWGTGTPEFRLALLDHEFCHIVKSQEDGTLTTVPHDLEEFRAIVRRHGLWDRSLERFAEQLTLPMGYGEAGDMADPDVPANGFGESVVPDVPLPAGLDMPADAGSADGEAASVADAQLAIV